MEQQMTMLDVVNAVSESCNSEVELVTTVAHLVNSGRVRLVGNFRGAWIDLGDREDIDEPIAA